jgi:hypothetical protein
MLTLALFIELIQRHAHSCQKRKRIERAVALLLVRYVQLPPRK